MGRGRQSTAGHEELGRAVRLGELLPEWYGRQGRSFPWREWSDAYRLTVVEVLLQRTRAERVEQYVVPFFAKYPGWEALAAASPSALELDLAPLGLHRRRSTTLVALAQAMAAPGDQPEHLPGHGQYVERAVRVASLNAPEAMVDSNFVRVLRRVFRGEWMSDYRYDRRLQDLALTVVRASGDPRCANWAILDLGALVCRPRRPMCPSCPVAELCLTSQAESGATAASARNPPGPR